jgi:hypothetical protein
MESIFLALSGVILLAGVLYWFWSHIQLTQKKVQLLENAVFELRGMLQRGGFTGGGTGGGGSGGSPDLLSSDEASPPRSPSEPISGANAAVSSMYNDLGDDDWKEDAEVVDHEDHVDISAGSTPLSALGLEESSDAPIFQEEEVNPDLQPGGRIQGVEEIGSGSGSGSELGPNSEQFRDLFTSPPTSVTEATSLDAMPVKDLRRLAEQRGIANASELRKKEILSALKAQIGGGLAGGSGSNGPSTVVQLEKTLDLTDVAEIVE